MDYTATFMPWMPKLPRTTGEDAEWRRVWVKGLYEAELMIAKLLVSFYVFWHGRLKLKGAGWLLRRFSNRLSGLRAFPFKVDGIGTAILDFQDNAAFSLVNVAIGDIALNRHLYEVLDRFVEEGAVLWDVGANLGYFSLYFARSPKRLKAIHAFEPNPSALKTLTSLYQNHPIVKVHPVGLGSADETLELQTVSTASPYGSLVRDIPDAKKVAVAIRQGDAYRESNGIDLPDLIKIDVEGFEGEVFEGLRSTIAAREPVIVFEHGLLEDEQLDSIIRSLPSGYEVIFFGHDGMVLKSREQRMEGQDAIAGPAEKLERLRSSSA